jgi:hypothetical protein
MRRLSGPIVRGLRCQLDEQVQPLLCSASRQVSETPLSRNDKIAIVGSALLLLAILAAGGFGLSMAYHYNEPASDVEAKQP